MKFIIFFIFIPLVYSELHTFITTYTGINGKTTAGIPEFSAVSTLDGQQMDYYDSNTMKLIPKQPWIKEFASEELWKEDIEIRKQVQQVYKNSIPVLMQRFNHSHGVHTYQRMYGCEWDDETGDSHGFDEYAYDGEDFISLDLKKRRYTAHVPQAKPTVMKWNNNNEQLKFLQYFQDYECVYWLKEFQHLSKATFKKADPPKVSLQQKSPGNYTCHVTGFLFRNTIILWRKNGRDINNSSKLMKSKDTLPNEDGTFQRTLPLSVLPDEWKSQYTCVVEHQSLTETIQKILTVNEIESNKSASDMHPVSLVIIVIVIVIVGLIGLILLWKHWKELKARSKRTIYVKTQSPEPEDPLISTPSKKMLSPPEIL